MKLLKNIIFEERTHDFNSPKDLKDLGSESKNDPKDRPISNEIKFPTGSVLERHW